jgi:N-acetylglutamate synthase-like GNAT family acetyltransferase
MTQTREIKRAGVRIRTARSEDWSAVSELLARAKLVALDPSAQFGPQYAVAEDPTGAIVGVAGYERYGADILLRSVAVSEDWHSRGVGRQLTEDRLANAASKGCRTAYLLTDTAKAYWERYGFVSIARTDAPAAITASQEWSHACPSTATAMYRRL